MATATTKARRAASAVLDVQQVAARFGVNAATVRSWVKAKRFPRPLACSPARWLWPAQVIERMLGREGITKR
jgi:predicted DNA-binding transcriptional regulator AlpA